MTSKYKPKDFDEYKKLILPAFWHARRKINADYGFICFALSDYWYCVRKTDSPSNRYGQAECARLMKSVLQGYVTLSSWLKKLGWDRQRSISGTPNWVGNLDWIQST